MSDETTQDEGITEMMWDALRVLATNRTALVRRHANLEAGEVPVRTASALEKRGLIERVPTGDKTTAVRLTAEGAGTLGISIDDVERLPTLNAQQIEHVNRALRYLGEAVQALDWADLPSPGGGYVRGVSEWQSALRSGQRLVSEASDSLIDGLETFNHSMLSRPPVTACDLQPTGTGMPGQPVIGEA
ncbi:MULTISPECIES: hypothetical protein [Microbacterium]|uniref:Uncharacterized protein n=1 Tax=Microbacterium hominis TaxID=162426 RepID=A0A2K9DQF1_9MICO|nr:MULTISPECIES: hypothetical protein [Microbacterium]AUG29446.1 hypothetical protein CXR34_08200 [Microbacterium hominis]EPD84141.1 hypothetical protein HMPREF1529_02181 [Microbacterium sp. oral taxon 186 str. F0373]